jgi:hypothetical protein
VAFVFDGVAHMKIQLQQMAVLLNFLVFREEGRALLNVIFIFSDLH